MRSLFFLKCKIISAYVNFTTLILQNFKCIKILKTNILTFSGTQKNYPGHLEIFVCLPWWTFYKLFHRSHRTHLLPNKWHVMCRCYVRAKYNIYNRIEKRGWQTTKIAFLEVLVKVTSRIWRETTDKKVF